MKQYGLTGFPLKNTFSADYFRRKLDALGLHDYFYHNFPLEHASSIPQLWLQNPHLYGLNVTIPHKQAVIPFLDKLSEEAAATGAVNCIRIGRDAKQQVIETVGYNTDVYGFEGSLLPLLQNRPDVKQALVLGTGGSSKAVAYVLKKLGIKYVHVSRQPAETAVSYAEADNLLALSLLVVNCTPLGMFPANESFPPLDYERITAKHIAFDLVYVPEETRFLEACRRQGAATRNGLGMLHLQADKAWAIWEA